MQCLSPEDEILYAFRRNVVVAASAGTGKTYRLTALYTLLTLGLTSLGRDHTDEAGPVVSPAEIAATTFSRAGAAEIRSRVDTVLSELCALPEGGVMPLKEVFFSRHEKLRKPIDSAALARLAAAAREQLSSATIDTLHGLAGKLVRAIALDIGLSPSFAVLEEDASTEVLDRAVDDVLVAALDDERCEAAEHLVDLAGGVEDVRAAVASLLQRLDEEGRSVDSLTLIDEAPHAQKLVAGLLEGIAQIAAQGPPAAKKIACAVLPIAQRSLSKDGQCTEPGALREALSAFAGKPLSGKDETSSLADIFERWGSPRTVAIEAVVHYLANWPRFASQAADVSRLLSDMERRRAFELARRGALGFGDLLRTARDALRDHPHLAAGAAAQTRVLLVDELQDTSPVQRDLVYLLHEDPARRAVRAAGQMPTVRELRSSGLFVVGDRKQAIYGFRGADVSVFGALCVALAGEEARVALGHPGAVGDDPPIADFVTLRENRRSTPTLLSFINAFGMRDMASATEPFETKYTSADHMVAATPQPTSSARPVEVLEDDGTTPEGAAPFVKALQGDGRTAAVAAGWVAHGIASGAFRASSVAIIARENASLVRVATALARLEVPYSMVGRGLLRTTEVRDAVAMLRLLADPEDGLALAIVLRSPWVGLDDATLVRLALPPGPPGAAKGLQPPHKWGPLLPALSAEGRSVAERFLDRWKRLLSLVAGQPPAAALDMAFEVFPYEEVIACLPRAAARLAHLERFRMLANAHGGALASFARSISRRIADDDDEREPSIASAGDEAVRLLTVHAAKGLEFPIVFVLDTDRWGRRRLRTSALALAPGGHRAIARLAVRPRDPSGAALVTPGVREIRDELDLREAAEARRLSYVAFTRAKERLVIALPTKPEGKPPRGAPSHTLRTMISDGLDRETLVTTPAALFLLDPPPPPPRVVAVEALRPFRQAPPQVPAARLTISPASLATFSTCARRFSLAEVVGVDESTFAVAHHGERTLSLDRTKADGRAVLGVLEQWPLASFGEPTDPQIVRRELAHAGLRSDTETRESVAYALAGFFQGPCARELRTRRVIRNAAYTLPIEASEEKSLRTSLLVRGVIDVLALREDEPAVVLAYCMRVAPADLARVTFRLRLHALAALRLWSAPSVRVGVLALDTADEPWFLGDGKAFSEADLRGFDAEVLSCAHALLEARTFDRYAGRPKPYCEAVGCGFVPVCHEDEGGGPELC